MGLKNLLIIFSLVCLIQTNIYAQSDSDKKLNLKIKQARQALTDLNCEESLKLSKEVLTEATKKNDNVLMAKALNVIGSNFIEFGDTQKAKKYYKDALNYALKTENDTIKDWIYNNIGAVYSYYENDFKNGIEYYKQGLYYTEKTKNPVQITYNALNISGAYFDEKMFEAGLPYLKKAEKYLSQCNELEANMNFYSQWGTYYSEKGNDNLAIQNYFKAISFGEHANTDLLDSYLVEVYKDVSTHFFKNKDYEKAYKYLNLTNTLKDKIYNKERIEKVQNFENELEIDEYKRQIDLIEREKLEKERSLQKTKIIIILFMIILGILSMFMYSLIKNNKIRKLINSQLESSNSQLKIAKEKAEELTQLKSQFISTITHEIRTPLYGVVGLTDIIADKHPDLKNSKHLNSLKFSAKYLLSLVNDVLQIYKISEKKIILENVPFNLRHELESIKNSLQIIAIKNKNKIEIEIDSDVPKFIIGDKIRLSQIFMNLISNSLKFTEEGLVEVKVSNTKKEGNVYLIKFIIKDNGIGIPEEKHEKVFDEFVQLERRKEDYQGTGLGLPIVKKLVELFNGNIKLESKENIGTIITFEIPFQEATTEIEENDLNVIEEKLKSKSLKILLVEDNRINQVVSKKILKKFNFKTSVAENGLEAVEACQNQTYDIILMDLNMPKMNGFEASKKIRELNINTPIIALTAFDKYEIEEKLVENGMNGVLIKPFESEDLYYCLSKHI